MQVKLCGLTSQKEVEYYNEMLPDYAGMVMFFEKSKRNIDIKTAKSLINALDRRIKTVAVTVKPTIEQILAITELGFDYIQIHGDVDINLINDCPIPVIRAFNVSNMDEVERLSSMPNIYAFLYDAVTPGSGKVFDWSLVPAVDAKDKLIILAGGLNPSNVATAISFVKPDCVDVSSGIENENGIGKSREKIIAFMEAAKT